MPTRAQRLESSHFAALKLHCDEKVIPMLTTLIDEQSSELQIIFKSMGSQPWHEKMHVRVLAAFAVPSHPPLYS
jgi:hypothetical protein